MFVKNIMNYYFFQFEIGEFGEINGVYLSNLVNIIEFQKMMLFLRDIYFLGQV